MQWRYAGCVFDNLSIWGIGDRLMLLVCLLASASYLTRGVFPKTLGHESGHQGR